MRTLTTLQTENPGWSFTKLVSETAFVQNSTESIALGNGSYSPKSLHYTNAPSNFLRHRGDPSANSTPAATAAKVACERTRYWDVRNYMKRTKMTSATDYTRLLQPGDICLKKRTVFPSHSPRKLCYKINFEIWKVKSRVATNSYRMTNLRNGNELVIAGDILVKLNNITEEEALDMCDEMERIANREATVTRAKIDEEASHGARGAGARRRSARRRNAREGRETHEEVEDPNLERLFKEDERPVRTTRSGRNY